MWAGPPYVRRAKRNRTDRHPTLIEHADSRQARGGRATLQRYGRKGDGHAGRQRDVRAVNSRVQCHPTGVNSIPPAHLHVRPMSAAEVLFLEVLEASRRVHGAGHPATLRAASDLLSTCRCAGEI